MLADGKDLPVELQELGSEAAFAKITMSVFSGSACGSHAVKPNLSADLKQADCEDCKGQL